MFAFMMMVLFVCFAVFRVFTEEIQKNVEAAYEGMYQHHNPQ